jgi:MYXO-CTERM domain-containing protein
LSFQPIFGGPAYAFRNVIVNVVDEQQKLHSLGGTEETVGALVYNNTFVSAKHAVNLQASATAHDFQLVNNLYVGPATPVSGKTVDWSVPIDNGTIDYNGYFPDGVFDFDAAGTWSTFAEMQSAGKFESHGVLLTQETFASGLAAPADYTTKLVPADAALAASSPAIDKGQILTGITDGFQGAAPDLGALESGCATPIYGVRPESIDETNEPRGCTSGSGGAGGNAGSTGSGASAGTGGVSCDGCGGTGGKGGSGTGGSKATGGTKGSSSDDDGGCGCRTERAPSRSELVLLTLLGALGLIRSRRR